MIQLAYDYDEELGYVRVVKVLVGNKQENEEEEQEEGEG